MSGIRLRVKVPVDGAVDDHVRHVNALRPKFARHALGQRPKRVLGAREKAENSERPRTLAVAPVKITVPRPRGVITRAASRPAMKPDSAAISHTLV